MVHKPKIQVDPESRRSVEQFKDDHTFKEFADENEFNDNHAFEEFGDENEIYYKSEVWLGPEIGTDLHLLYIKM